VAAENPLSVELKQTQDELAARRQELEVARDMLEQVRGKLHESLEIERALSERMTQNTHTQQARTTELSAALDAASAALEHHRQQITLEQAENQALAAERDQLRDELVDRDQQLATVQAELQAAAQTQVAEGDQLRDKLVRRNEQLDTVHAELQAATQTLAETRRDAGSTGEALSEARARVGALGDKLSKLEAERVRQETRLQTSQQDWNKERDQLGARLASRDKQLTVLQAEHEAATTRAGAVDTELADVKAQLETYETTLLEKGASLAAMKTEREALRADLNLCNQELAEARVTLTDLQTEIDAFDLERLVVIEVATPTAAGGPDTMAEPATPAETTVDAVVVATVNMAMDADGDGIADDRDLCPGTTQINNVDSTGCDPGAAIKLEGVNFLYDSHELTADAQRILARVAAVIGQHPDLRLQVAGHTDATGDPAYNQFLSMQRAEAVMDYLVAQGVKRDHIGAVGYGGQRPIADNDTLEGLRKNRRVELRRMQ
jgi:OOP family OmpA-OmpF porin